MSLEGPSLGGWHIRTTLELMACDDNDTNVKAVCNTLDQLHDKGYIHGDAHIRNVVHASSPPATGAGKYVWIDLERCHKLSDLDEAWYGTLKCIDLMHLMRHFFHYSVCEVVINDKGLRECHECIFRYFYKLFLPLYSSEGCRLPSQLTTWCMQLFNEDVLKYGITFNEDSEDAPTASIIEHWFTQSNAHVQNILNCEYFTTKGNMTGRSFLNIVTDGT